MSVLFWELNQLTPEIVIPEDLHERLHQYSLQVALSNMKLYHELKIVLQAMNEADIPTIVLKGAHLAALVYPDISMRQMGDIDLMVPVERLEGGARVLKGLGYRASLGYDVDVIIKLRHHLPPFIKEGNKAIELHWTFLVPRSPYVLDLKAQWQRNQTVMISNVSTSVLSPEDLLLHLSVHAIYQHKLALGLRNFYDIKMVLDHFENKIRWQFLEERQELLVAKKPIYISLEMTKKYFNCVLPSVTTNMKFKESDEIIELVKRYSLNRPQKLSENIIEFTKQLSFFEKCRYLFSRVFISRNEISVNYGYNLKSHELIYFYFFRVWDLFRKHFNIFNGIFFKEKEQMEVVEKNTEIIRLINLLNPD
jgi:hypothetical protein